MISPAPGILKIFALILSSRWIKQWQKEKKQEQEQNRPSGKEFRRVKGQRRSAGRKAKNKAEPESFYDRIFSLQVTLWCMIFQRLNSDRTLDSVLKDVVMRLTSVRARKLAAGVALRSGEDRAVCWQPSGHDKGAPDVKREGVSGRLIYMHQAERTQAAAASVAEIPAAPRQPCECTPETRSGGASSGRETTPTNHQI